MAAAPDPIAAHAATRPDAAAVVTDEGSSSMSTTTWSELNKRVNRLADSLSATGAQRGDRLVWCGPNSVDVLTTIHASRKVGLTAVPLPYRFNASEMAYVVDNSDAVVVVADAEQVPLLESVRAELPAVKAWVGFGDELPDGWLDLDTLIESGRDQEPNTDSQGSASAGASMIYTSGTTGRPKGALRTHTDPATVLGLAEKLRWFHDSHVHLTTGPLYHSGPLAFASLAHTAGATIVVTRRFDPRHWLEMVQAHRVTSTFCAPTHLKRIVSLPDEVLATSDTASLVSLIANAAPVPYPLKEEVITKLGDGFLFEVYGSTELGVTCVLEPEDQLRKPGSCGRPIPHVEVRIVTETGADAEPGTPGELFVRSALALDGYHRTDEKITTLADEGWKSVGDVAYVDDEGYVYICDRLKDMIISGGVNIYPAEIEAVLHEHPGLLDAAVFGVPDEEWGEQVHCVLQPRPGVDLDVDDVRALVESRVARYKRPRSYEVRDALPRTESGKLLKRVLRAEYWPDPETNL